jgi:hypothetical protein
MSDRADAVLERLLLAVLAMQEEQRAQRRLLERLQAPSRLSPAERELLEALSAVMGGEVFTSGEALELARLPLGDRPRLARALAALGIGTAKELGEQLRAVVDRCAGDRVRVLRCGVEHGSRLWRVEGGTSGDVSPDEAGQRPRASAA